MLAAPSLLLLQLSFMRPFRYGFIRVLLREYAPAFTAALVYLGCLVIVRIVETVRFELSFGLEEEIELTFFGGEKVDDQATLFG